MNTSNSEINPKRYEPLKIKRIIEALLFVSEEPLSLDALKEITDIKEGKVVRELVEELNQEYASEKRSFGIRNIANGYQIYTYPEYAPWVKKMFKSKREAWLSTPALETLAIIAYRQPMTRSEIEFIRGVSVEGVLNTLLERGLIKTMGRKDVVGRPIIYGTTKFFLKHFGLNTLNELPDWERFIEGKGDKNEEEDLEGTPSRDR